ncbi:hypothetical protein ROTAS13_04194 [Roseomonas sp. TAS13]|nr:hypothetical protein ROTAS13_04194 [Roseomonas sp. TAS13]
MWRRVVAAAQGMTAARAVAPSCATPGAASRLGPRGPSGVMAARSPRASRRRMLIIPEAPPREVEPWTVSSWKRAMMSPMKRPSLWRETSTWVRRGRSTGKCCRARRHSIGIIGRRSCQKETISGRPVATASAMSSRPRKVQRVVA